MSDENLEQSQKGMKILPLCPEGNVKKCACGHLNNFSLELNTEELRYGDSDSEDFRQGNELYCKGMIDEAEEHLKRSIEASPDHAESHLILGDIYERKSMYDDAIREYAEAIRIRPEDEHTKFKLDVISRKRARRKNY